MLNAESNQGNTYYSNYSLKIEMLPIISKRLSNEEKNDFLVVELKSKKATFHTEIMGKI